MANNKKEPTKKQKDYAASIARELNIKPPEENTSAAYREFISKNQERFIQSRPVAVHFTDEQIARANAVDILGYARSMGLELKRDGKDYRVKNYSGGFVISPEKNNWNWFKENRGGGVVQLCMFLENKTWQEAIGALLNEDMEPIRRAPDWKPEPVKPKEFHLPERNDTNKHVYAYLTKTRGIDAGIVKQMLDQGYIYENQYKSCVFVGRDSEGVPKHASVRSTNTTGKVYKKDVSGSQKKYSFSVVGTSGVADIFEAPIDALSYMSIQKLQGKPVNDSYIALGGVTDKALERFLEDNKNIKIIRICTDGDEAGNNAATRISEKYGEDYKVIRQSPEQKDFNEDLVVLRKILDESTKEKSFAQQVDEALEGTMNQYNALKVCDTPEILINVGCKQLPMLYTQRHLKNALKPKDEKHSEYHGLTKEEIKKLPELIHNPVMIFDSLSRKDSIVIVTSALDSDNAPLLVSFRPNGVGTYELEKVNANFITSVYGKDSNFSDYVERIADKGNILYCDKQKSQELFMFQGLQLPEAFNNLDFDRIIHQSNNIVKDNQEMAASKGKFFFCLPDFRNVNFQKFLWSFWIVIHNSDFQNPFISKFC